MPAGYNFVHTPVFNQTSNVFSFQFFCFFTCLHSWLLAHALCVFLCRIISAIPHNGLSCQLIMVQISGPNLIDILARFNIHFRMLIYTYFHIGWQVCIKRLKYMHLWFDFFYSRHLTFWWIKKYSRILQPMPVSDFRVCYLRDMMFMNFFLSAARSVYLYCSSSSGFAWRDL